MRRLLFALMLALLPLSAQAQVAGSWPTGPSGGYPLTDGATISPLCPGSADANGVGLSGFYSLTVLGNNHTISLPSCPTPSAVLFRITQGAGGPYTGLSFSAGANTLNYTNKTAYVQTPTAGATDDVGGQIVSSTVWDLFAPQLNMGPSLFTPLLYADLASWFDFSDAATTYSGTTCSGGKISSGALGSILAKGGQGYCMAFSGGAATLTTDGSGTYISFGSATVVTLNTGTGASPLAYVNNAPYAEAIMGVQYPSGGGTGQFGIFFSTNSGSGTTRFGCGLDITGGAVGIDARARRVDTDAANDANAGTDTGYLTPNLLAENCLVSYAANSVSVQANNGTVFSAGLTGSSNSPATNSLAAGNGGLPILSSGRMYQLILRLPTSAPTTLSMQLGQTFVCTKMGTTC